MENTTPAPREKIVYAAIECIEKYGISRLTIRNIAKAAGVNSAAINYYFRSKDLLIEEAVRISLHHGFSDWERFLNDPALSPVERFRGFLMDFFEGGMRFPGMTRAYLFESAMQEHYGSLFVPRFNALLDRFAEELSESCGDMPKEKIRFSVVQILSAVTFAILSPGFFNEFLGRGFTDETLRKKYVDHLLATVLHAS
ncbi:TetR/AcrR family transcriptional regulator [bacterium]|nr:TetR/AcrR family transcriptional regulator [bacterium]